MTGFIPQVNFWDAFRGGHEEKRRVLSQMVRLRGVSPPVLLAYCRCSSILHIPQPNLLWMVSRTFGLDGAGAMLTRLRLVLTEWETNFKEGFAANLVSIQQHPFIPSLLTTFLTTKVPSSCVILLTWKAGLRCRYVPMTMRGSSLYYKKCSSEQSVSHSTRR